MKPIRTLLHPTDFSEDSDSALELACSLARDLSAQIHIVHVIPHPPAVFWHVNAPHRPLAGHIHDDLRAYHDALGERLKHLPVPFALILVTSYLVGRAGGRRAS